MKCKHHVELAEGETCKRQYHGERFSAFDHVCDQFTSSDNLSTVLDWAHLHDRFSSHHAFVFDKHTGEYVRDHRRRRAGGAV